MGKQTPQEATARYYSRLGSRLGYRFVMNRSQHFGYYDNSHRTEQDAQEKYHQEFAKLLALKPGMELLDAGCGQGVVACYLASRHKVRVQGITITPYEVKAAKKRAHRQGVDAATSFILADYSDPPFSENTFDRIYTTETLSHAIDVKQVLAVFMKLLKPGGSLVCAEYEMDYEHFDATTKEMAEFVKCHAAIHGIYQFGRGQFVSSIKKAGFTDVKEIDWTPHIKPSFDRLKRLAGPIARTLEKTRLKKHFVNVVAARLYAEGVEEGVFAYGVYIAKKPV